MRVSCLAFCNSVSKEFSSEGRFSASKPGEQKASHRKRLRRRGAVCGVAAPLRCHRHRRRRVSWHPAPRRSQRRLTPFFSSLPAVRMSPSSDRAAKTALAVLTLINLFNYLDRYVVASLVESLKKEPLFLS